MYNLTDLNARAMLCYLSVSVWSARKLDTKATGKVTRGAKATGDAARVNKHLLASADEKLRAIQRIGKAMRSYIEDNTLPWDDAGNRLLPNEKALVVVAEAQAMGQEFEDAVDAFVQEYPALRAQAIVNLGDMGDDSDYPAPDVVRTKFSMRLSFNPLPSGFGDVRVAMNEAQVNALEAHFKANSSKQLSMALHSAWQQLREHLERYSDRLQKRDDEPEKMRVFRDTMVENLRRTTSLLRDLNIFNDPDMAALANEVARDIAIVDSETLRSSEHAANAVKAKADDILSRMKSLLGE
jgi:hypothetical protein